MPSAPFFAMIIPMSGGGVGSDPPGIWGGANQPFPTPPIHMPPTGALPPSPGVPTHPIYYPPGIWGPTDPRPGWGLPQPPTGSPGVPTHPIYYPPGIWGPTDPRPGWGLPQPPTGSPPGFWGGGNVPMPSPPIYLPPVVPGGPPLVIWGPGDPRPQPPIHLPPPPTDGIDSGGGKPPPADGGWGYHPDYGWGYFPPADMAQPKK